MLELLRLSDVAAAWRDASVRNWLSDPVACERDKAELRNKLIAAVKRQYDARATMLRERHPLGIQVNLATGVANGVLVVRTVEQCAELVRQIVTSTLEFHVEEAELGGLPYVFLRERISGCIFRVMTGDQQLSNAFWNFYLQPS